MRQFEKARCEEVLKARRATSSVHRTRHADETERQSRDVGRSRVRRRCRRLSRGAGTDLGQVADARGDRGQFSISRRAAETQHRRATAC